MPDKYRHLIKEKYLSSWPDSMELFRTILSVAEETGMDWALECLEECVTEKRMQWIGKNLGKQQRTGNPLHDGYTIFYQAYLGASLERDGEIVEETGAKLVTRWWNRCPTLEACMALNLDTREICSRVYHRPVQAFLSAVDSRLTFERNYSALRPYTPYCEEILMLKS
jgi:hypothetical protein